MSNYIYVILPAVYGYVMKYYCPLVDKDTKDQRRGELAEKGLLRIHDVVWPLLFLMIGFSWYFSKGSKIKLSKRASNATSYIGSILGKDGYMTTLDSLYVLFTLMLGWLMVVNTCANDRRNAMLVLFFTGSSAMMLMYFLTSQHKSGLFALIPVMVWLFFTGEYSLRSYTESLEVDESIA